MEAWTRDLAVALNETSAKTSLSSSPVAALIDSSKTTSDNKNRVSVSLPRRRTKSTGNLVDYIAEESDSEGEMEEHPAQSSLQLTETDDGSCKEKKNVASKPQVSFLVPLPQPRSSLSLLTLARAAVAAGAATAQSVAESDSLNENISPMRPHTRRKRRFKRMAVDPEPLHQMHPVAADAPTLGNADLLMDDGKTFHSFSSFASSSIFAKPRQRKVKRKPINVQKVGPNAVVIGKRKRSVRERSIECELEKISLNSSPETGDLLSASASVDSAAILVSSEPHHSLTDSMMDLDMKQQMEQVSSSSVSGSESDPGFYTYDDGREADDEQSDWYQESGQTWGIVKPCWWENNGNPPPPLPGGSSSSRGDLAELEAIADADTDDDAIDDTRFQQLLKGSWQHLSDDAKDAYRLRMQKLRDRIPGREIRAGRRHLGAQRGPAFSILTSANEKLSRFLQDPAQSELRLHPMQKSERDQLSHLASLYSLQMMSEGARGLKCPILKKTSNTMQAVRIDMDRSPSLWSDHYKRQRKTPPASLDGDSTPAAAPPPIADSNVGNQILQHLGWRPGSGLGRNNQGRTAPITATVRPKYLGLGHGSADAADP